MSLSTQPITPSAGYALHSIEDYQKAEAPATWGTTIRNFIIGNVCKDWERSVLTAKSIACVFFAALNLLWGTFLMSVFFLFSAAIDAIAIQKLRNFASWNRNLEAHQKNNDYQAVLLYKNKLQLQDLSKNNAQFRSENERLGRQLDSHQDLVRQQGEHVALHGQLNQELGQHAASIARNLPLLDDMIARSHGHEKAQLEELRRLALLAEETHKKNAAISATQDQLNLSNRELLQQAQNITSLLETTDKQLVQNIAGLRQDLETLRDSIIKNEGKLEGQLDALKTVTDRLDNDVSKGVQAITINAERANAVLGQVLEVNARVPAGGRATARIPNTNVHGFRN